MADVIIIGSGGHAAEIDEYIKYNQLAQGEGILRVAGFLDDNPDNYKRYKFSAPFIGGIKEHNIIKGQSYIIGIAGLEFRKPIVERFLNKGGIFVSIIHRSAYISDSAIIGNGSIIGPNANLGPNVRIGVCTLINSRCSMAHDTIVGNFNFISPNVCFSGFTQVGDENLFGINCATIPGVKIGNRNKISAGMIIDIDVGDDSVIFYRFKEKVIAVPKQLRD